MTTDYSMHSILVKALGLENEPIENQNRAVEGMGAVIYQAVITRAMEEMNDEQIDAFEKITDGEPTPEILIQFFLENIPDFETMMKEEATRIVADSVNIMSKVNEN